MKSLSSIEDTEFTWIYSSQLSFLIVVVHFLTLVAFSDSAGQKYSICTRCKTKTKLFFLVEWLL